MVCGGVAVKDLKARSAHKERCRSRRPYGRRSTHGGTALAAPCPPRDSCHAKSLVTDPLLARFNPLTPPNSGARTQAEGATVAAGPGPLAEASRRNPDQAIRYRRSAISHRPRQEKTGGTHRAHRPRSVRGSYRSETGASRQSSTLPRERRSLGRDGSVIRMASTVIHSDTRNVLWVRIAKRRSRSL